MAFSLSVTGNVEKVIETGASGGSDIAVAPDGRTLLLADPGRPDHPGGLLSVDGITNEITQVASWDRGGPWKIALSQGGQWALAVDGKGAIRRVDLVARNMERMEVGKNLTGIALVPDSEELAWVSDSGSNTVFLVHWKDRRILHAIPVGTDPQGLAVHRP